MSMERKRTAECLSASEIQGDGLHKTFYIKKSKLRPIMQSDVFDEKGNKVIKPRMVSSIRNNVNIHYNKGKIVNIHGSSTINIMSKKETRCLIHFKTKTKFHIETAIGEFQCDNILNDLIEIKNNTSINLTIDHRDEKKFLITSEGQIDDITTCLISVALLSWIRVLSWSLLEQSDKSRLPLFTVKKKRKGGFVSFYENQIMVYSVKKGKLSDSQGQELGTIKGKGRRQKNFLIDLPKYGLSGNLNFEPELIKFQKYQGSINLNDPNEYNIGLGGGVITNHENTPVITIYGFDENFKIYADEEFDKILVCLLFYQLLQFTRPPREEEEREKWV